MLVMRNTYSVLIALGSICLTLLMKAEAQTNSQPVQQQAATTADLPFTTQLKKAIVFVETDCLHVPTPEELATLDPTERAKWTPEAIAQLRPAELLQMKRDPWYGTGFIVFVPEGRLGTDRGIVYIITNRHVAQPGIEHGRPCKVVARSFRLNRRYVHLGEASHLQVVPTGVDDTWIYPDDPAVDLAVSNVSVSQEDWDYLSIPLGMFLLEEMVDQKKVVEGDPVLFAGVFIQYSGVSKLDPIVRSGSIAMFPSDLIGTTLGKPGRVYFTEAHVFGGNSGSPMFVQAPLVRSRTEFNFKFLGVVSGEVFESSDLTLQVATSYKANLAANSNISVVVPAEEVKKLLLSPRLVKGRDDFVAAYLLQKK